MKRSIALCNVKVDYQQGSTESERFFPSRPLSKFTDPYSPRQPDHRPVFPSLQTRDLRPRAILKERSPVPPSSQSRGLGFKPRSSSRGSRHEKAVPLGGSQLLMPCLGAPYSSQQSGLRGMLGCSLGARLPPAPLQEGSPLSLPRPLPAPRHEDRKAEGLALNCTLKPTLGTQG